MSQANLLEIFRFLWLVPLLLSLLGFFLSLWIIIPASTFSLLPLGVGAPELSPWLIVINAIALLLTVLVHNSWLSAIIFICSLLGLILSLLPLLQLPAANGKFTAEMTAVLGTDYLQAVPQALQNQMRPQPFAIADVFRGIPIKEVRIERGIIFANPDQVDLKLNLYRPPLTGKYPALIIIYGGAWREGNPDSYETYSSYMAAQGYSVIAIDYRHAPQYKFPAQLEDVKLAVQYIQDRADDFEVDTKRMAIMGRSAGGHLATLAAYQQNAFPFRAVVSYYGAVNLTKGYYDPPVPNPIDIQTVLQNFLGGTPEELPELYRQASPINYPRLNLPPSLLVYAGRDHLVQAKFGRQLYNKLKATDNRAVLLEIPWAEHAFDAVFFGVSNQLALYHTERFLAWALKSHQN
ncbi:esterase/lipase [Xenococcus sp. PCC 7305]|uniref:alpha/beta hydrolase n=1 Tax=Xenococcus sp. PCC 7305 TaxID=102125 RepID=UPI0002ABA278|nr:alpha/beta hydrolase [Xenococcus sp. PCC 7305]ELS03062.1 esterase/lipase [Xenococcus sp. PCC 7305]